MHFKYVGNAMLLTTIIIAPLSILVFSYFTLNATIGSMISLIGAIALIFIFFLPASCARIAAKRKAACLVVFGVEISLSLILISALSATQTIRNGCKLLLKPYIGR